MMISLKLNIDINKKKEFYQNKNKLLEESIMKNLKSNVLIKVNRLDELLSSDFKVENFGIGTDLLELRVPIKDKKEEYVELTLWVNGRGQSTGAAGESVELLIGNRDSDGELDIIEDFGEYELDSFNNAQELLDEMTSMIVAACKF